MNVGEVSVSGPGVSGAARGPLALAYTFSLAALLVAGYVAHRGFETSRENTRTIEVALERAVGRNSQEHQDLAQQFAILACTLQYPPERRLEMTRIPLERFREMCAWFRK